ncbi:MAG: DNA oxidative demethylase AlkB [Gammaproteobacteria bacterium]|nr:DNA oxidative demethylase AlkB [Gammaproteobacteria bacterium]
MMEDLFSGTQESTAAGTLPAGVMLLPGFALALAPQLLEDVARMAIASPPRRMQTPGGHWTSVNMSNCGEVGWVSDRRGYRYEATDPLTGEPWPALPAPWLALAKQAAEHAGFADFMPDACLVNHYAVGTRMGLHQDRDERDFSAPIVSVSLGLPVVFQFGGATRSAPVMRIPLEHGDVIVWGGPARRHYHGVLTLKPGVHPATGAHRINLTFRKAQ